MGFSEKIPAFGIVETSYRLLERKPLHPAVFLGRNIVSLFNQIKFYALNVFALFELYPVQQAAQLADHPALFAHFPNSRLTKRSQRLDVTFRQNPLGGMAAVG